MSTITTRDVIANFITSTTDKKESERRNRAATSVLKTVGQKYVGDPDGFVKETNEAELAIKRDIASMAVGYVANRDGFSAPEELEGLWIDLKDLREALDNSPCAEVIAGWNAALQGNGKINHESGLKDAAGKKIMLIPTSYKTMKSTILKALKRGDTDIEHATKTELREGKAAARAASVVTAETLMARWQKLNAQADANGYVWNGTEFVAK